MSLSTKQKLAFPFLIVLFLALGWEINSLYAKYLQTKNDQSGVKRLSMKQHEASQADLALRIGHLQQASAKPQQIAASTRVKPIIQQTDTPHQTQAALKPATIQPAIISPAVTKPIVRPVPLAANTLSQPVTAAKVSMPTPIISKQQAEYLQLVKQFQIAQMKRMIAQEQEAIAIAKRNTLKAEHEGKFVQLAKASVKPKQTLTDAVPNYHVPTYKLLSTYKKANAWQAALRYQGKLMRLHQGQRLPNGAKVASISQNLVVLRQGQREILVSFFNTTTRNAAKPKPHSASKAKPLKQAKRDIKPVVKHYVPKPAEPVITIEQSSASVASQPAVGAKPKVAVLKKLEVKKIARKYSPLEQRLLQVNSNFYTIQLMANSDYGVVKKYQDANGLETTTAIYKTYLNNKAWFVLVAAEKFQTAQAALSAISDLPINLHRFSPFVKSYRLIHEEIAKTV